MTRTYFTRLHHFPFRVLHKYITLASSIYPSITPLGMTQTPAASPDWQNGNNNQQDTRQHLNQDIPIDPSLILSNTTYLPHGGQYSPYPPKGSLQRADSNAPFNGAMHTQPRPDWTTYGREQHPTYNEYMFNRRETSHAFLDPGGVCPIPGNITLIHLK